MCKNNQGYEGYQVNVRKHTDLTGGLITSTAQAEADGKNSFSTGTLSYSDIQNYANYSGTAFGAGVQADINGGWDGRQVRDKDDNIILNEDGSRANRVNQGIGFGYEKESQASITKAGINTANIHIRNEKAQQSLTGKPVDETLKDIKTEITTENAQANAGELENHFDKDKLQKELAIQQATTQNFAPVAAQGVAWASEQLGAVQNYEVLSARKSQVEAALSNTTNPEERSQLQSELTTLTDYLNDNQTRYDLWKEGGVGRALLHAAAGGILTGNVTGAVAAGTTSLAAPAIEKLGEKAEEKFGKVGKVAVNATAGLAIGAAVGNGNVGAISAGANTDWNNRQLHPDEMKWIKENAKHFAKEQGISETEAEQQLMQQAARETDILWNLKLADEDNMAKQAAAFLEKQKSVTFIDSDGNVQHYFVAQGNDFWRPLVYAKEAAQFNQENEHFINKTLTDNVVRSKSQGIRDKLGSAYESIKLNPIETAKNIGTGLLNSTVDCAKSPVDCVTEAVSNTANVAITSGVDMGKNLFKVDQNKLNQLYGSDVEGDLAIVSSSRLALSGLELMGAGKTISAAGKGVAVGTKEAIKAGGHQINRVTNHSVLNRIVDEFDANAVISTEKGFINASKVCQSACELKPTSNQERELIDSIVKNGDRSGENTEKLIASLAERSGYKVLEGGKYGSNNGFDHILLGKDGSIVIIDSKQLRNGAVQVSNKAAGNSNQLSRDWIAKVVGQLPDKNVARQINNSLEKETIKTIVAGVDKRDGTIKLIPVKIPDKTK